MFLSHFSAAALALGFAAATPTPQRTGGSPSSPESMCGRDQYDILLGTPWIVYNMVYNADQMVGTQCTDFHKVQSPAGHNMNVKWSSVADIDYVESTDNVPKGYSFVGLTQNLENTIADISSIPSGYRWRRTNSTAFKGNVCYDFMVSPTKGDSTSSSTTELMLWLQYEGGQLPIGWGDGPAATIDSLYGTSWKLYEGLNTDTGITVRSLLPDEQFDGRFVGDIKDWLMALVGLGRFDESAYVNVGNAGTEFFYGNSVLNATLSLQVNL